MTPNEKYLDYLDMLRKPFHKLCRLRFLQPDGSTAFMLDNHVRGEGDGAFISDGTITHNWQNGRRTNATVTISNVDGAYDYSFNTVWFGQEIALDEGMILSDGETEFYLQQGVFLIDTPSESVRPGNRVVTYSLVDKVAALDGTLGGHLEGTHQVPVGTNIFQPIVDILAEDKGNGRPVDNVHPIFTEYYNGKTQELPDGTTAAMTDSPYTLTIDGTDGTVWQVIEGLAGMVNGWVGYDETGALRIDPSQDDIIDSDKPIAWDFTMDEAELLGMTYQVKNTEVFNDYIVIGEAITDGTQPCGRAQVLDPRSPVDIRAIGRKTIRVSQAGFATVQQCQDYAAWMLKRSAVLQRSVTISCSQILHIHGNDIVTITRTDKQGRPKERHLIHGFSRPLAGTGEMTINAVSVNDFPITSVAYVGMISFIPSQVGGLSYTGSAQSPVWNDFVDTQLEIGGTYSATNAGTYTAQFTPINGYVWWDGTNSPKSADWTITKQPVAIPKVSGTYTYTGSEQTVVLDGYDSTSMTKSGTQSATDVGSYVTKVSLRSTANYMWNDGTYSTKSFNWSIGKRSVTPPKVIGTYTYSGQNQTVQFSGFDAGSMSKSGTLTAKNAGSYTAKVSLTDTVNNQWSDGTTATKGYGWSIGKAVPAYTAPTAKSLTYTGSAQAVLNAGSTSNGTIQYSADNSTWGTSIPTKINAGTYTVYWRLVGDANHKDVASKAISVSIAKATPAVPTLSVSTLSFDEVTSKKFTVTRSGDGAISAASSDTSIATATVSGTTVTVKSVSKTGTARITITVAAGSNYNAYTGTGARCTVTVAPTTTNCLEFSKSSGSFTLSFAPDEKTWNGTIQWTNGTALWQAWNGADTLTSSGAKLYLRGIGNTQIMRNVGAYSNGFVIVGSAVSCSGNIETLLDYQTVANGQHPSQEKRCFGALFRDCTSLVSAPTLGATAVADSAYFAMFQGCTGLTTAPALPATDVGNSSYNGMFYGCTGLTVPPALPAMTVGDSCYSRMFYGCTALTTVAELPATTLGYSCYANMYRGCSNVMISETQTGAYQYAFRIPKEGTASGNAVSDMFTGTGGTYRQDPRLNTTYYTTQPPVG